MPTDFDFKVRSIGEAPTKDSAASFSRQPLLQNPLKMFRMTHKSLVVILYIILQYATSLIERCCKDVNNIFIFF